MFVIPTEGGNFIARYLLRREIPDRDPGLLLGLFTNVTADLATTLAALTQPTGIGYEQALLDDTAWLVNGVTATQAQRLFTAGAGGWNGIVQGYFLMTLAEGGTPRLIGYEFDRQQQLAPGTLVRLGGSVTCVTPVPHLLADNGLVNIRGAVQPEYNGVFPIAVTGSNSFTYTIAGSPASPATGVILVNRCYQMNVGANYDVDLSLVFGT